MPPHSSTMTDRNNNSAPLTKSVHREPPRLPARALSAREIIHEEDEERGDTSNNMDNSAGAISTANESGSMNDASGVTSMNDASGITSMNDASGNASLNDVSGTMDAASGGGDSAISYTQEDEDIGIDDDEEEYRSHTNTSGAYSENDDSIYEEQDEDFSMSLSGGQSVGSSQSQNTDDQSFSTNDNSTVQTKEPNTVAHSETRVVRRLRIFVILTLIALGTILSVTLFKVSEQSEQEEMEDALADFSYQVHDAWQASLEQSFAAMDSLRVHSTLSTSNQEWPLVTLDDFYVRGNSARLLAGALVSISLVPLVTENSQLASYENYTRHQDDLVGGIEGISRHRQRQLHEDTEVEVEFINGRAQHAFYTKDDKLLVQIGLGPYNPIRHGSPVAPEWVNYDLASNSYHTQISGQDPKAILGPLLDDPEDLDAKTLLELLPPSIVQEGTLVGTMVFPILDTLNGDGVLVGLLSGLVDWQALLSNILPPSVQGLVVVVENTCGQQYTLQLNGPQVERLGSGDRHNTRFNSFVHSFGLKLNLESSTPYKIEFDEASDCQYTMHIYPSSNFEDHYLTKSPTLYAVIAVAVFCATIILFAVYDFIVERRQRLVLKSAMEARAIVSSLFPAVVRDRLFESNREKKKQKKKDKKKSKKKSKGDDKVEPEHPTNLAGSDGEFIIETVPGSPMSLDMERAPALHGSLNSAAMKQIMNGLGAPPLGGGETKLNRKHSVQHPKHRLKSFLADGDSRSQGEAFSGELGLGKPIADLFPHTTVLFADIVGFTAWSSEREPEQVFTLLQTVYHAFDKIARKRKVFKVETIGDCYVAVTGLPDPQPDHAVRMTKFARECMTRMTEVTKKLEVSLGPDTADLCMRLGMHSGPVTAGVLMGEKSRFQLFGDTVNMASRMESTGERNKLQVSQATADQLMEAGKAYWVKQRDKLVAAKGKGEVQTYWIVNRGSSSEIPFGARSQSCEMGPQGVETKRVTPPRTRSMLTTVGSVRGVQRATSDSLAKMTSKVPESTLTMGARSSEKREESLVEWQVEMFTRLLKAIVATRGEGDKTPNPPERTNSSMNQLDSSQHSNRQGLERREPSFRAHIRRTSQDPSMGDDETIVMDEVAEAITLPKFDPKKIKAIEKVDTVELTESVKTQLHDFIATMAKMYRSNPFHNFEHASHVTMSANKLLNRIVIPENVDYERESHAIASDLHDYTYGITSDPLTQFAIVFSALIHDVDHTGVPNGQLAKENPEMAELYRNQSLAEQNSVDMAWDLFLDPRYKALQECIAHNNEEKNRFRQLVVNSVMATDIFDKDMKALRNKRWDKAFHLDMQVGREIGNLNIEEDTNMKATIVIEHIIQASDVAHTMQHWQIYQKWNERLFEEMYSAFECGRSDKNPSDGWYKGELWFFDNYVIPLAKKLEECNVFGVASDECLNYARANRNEWYARGEKAVADMVSRYEKRKLMMGLGVGLPARKNLTKPPP
jgi:class 3 adenylate cyclase